MYSVTSRGNKNPVTMFRVSFFPAEMFHGNLFFPTEACKTKVHVRISEGWYKSRVAGTAIGLALRSADDRSPDVCDSGRSVIRLLLFPISRHNRHLPASAPVVLMFVSAFRFLTLLMSEKCPHSNFVSTAGRYLASQIA